MAYLLSSLFVGVSVADLFTMMGASLLLLDGTLAASWLPARRATLVGRRPQNH